MIDADWRCCFFGFAGRPRRDPKGAVYVPPMVAAKRPPWVMRRINPTPTGLLSRNPTAVEHGFERYAFGVVLYPLALRAKSDRGRIPPHAPVFQNLARLRPGPTMHDPVFC
uniref:Uncharacterized protein n=1 Tax=Candidatus Kentrum sp. SD TaxID=2126332 RepID=A0A450YGD2_9GAMM|nr:MAG: hypothetical protein BECKSD772F_GA0070984_106310 [Candidatus Kentron sp. SD]VFK45671.1 MAG: hypothetical protein BECKSD772E_GA0070983_105810 [Candidatus Kentron sp. SD]VFK79065.1 MAG: hypothetical protein BECKSD772D_GA0070982_103423 [Candidatus Kentron sp. SD]